MGGSNHLGVNLTKRMELWPCRAVSTVGIRGVSGDFNGMGTLSNVSFRIRQNRLFNLVNPSNTNGAALFQLLAALLGPSRKQTRISNFSVIGSCRTVHRHIKCVPKHFSLCRSLAMRRGLGFFTTLFNMGIRSSCSLITPVCHRVRPFGGHETNGLSKNVGRGLTLSYTLVRHPDILFLSRPAANISTMSEYRF